MANETSLKGIIQGMMFDSAELMQGTVIATDPVKIQMANDEKLIITERITVIPRHLSDYTTKATITIGDGEIDSVTTVSGGHNHGYSVQDGESVDEGDSAGDEEIGDGEHEHPLRTYTLTKGMITVYNALSVGEEVYVLSLNRGKLYYVLDRAVS